MAGINRQTCPLEPIEDGVIKHSGAEHCISILYCPGIKNITLHAC